MRPTPTAAALAVLMLVVVTAAQTPLPQPAPDPAVRDAIKRKLDEMEARLREIRIWRNTPRPDTPPPQPEPKTPPSIDDDYLGDAGELFESLLLSFGSPSVLYGHIKDIADKEKDTKDSLDLSQTTREMLDQLANDRYVEKLEKDYVQLQGEYVQAGGRLGLLQFTVEAKSKDEDSNRLNDEYIAEETKRLKDLENKREKTPTPPKDSPPPPPPPPLSFRFDTPQWDVASTTYVAGSAFGATASFQFDYSGGAAATVDTLLKAPLALGQGQDAVPEEDEEAVLIPRAGMPADDDGRSHWHPPVFASLVRPRLSSVARITQAVDAIPRPSAKVFFTSLGGSTGATVQMTVVNDGNVPIRIASDGFALEPVANMTAIDVERELRRLGDLPRKTLTLRAYCRDVNKTAPVAGQILRLADPSVQAQMAPFRRVLAASRRLLDAGVLKPDVERELYLDSVRQWARWTMAEKFNERSFITAFIEHTKKNTIAAGQKWEKAFDGEARQIAGERWRDVQRVLTEAQTAVR